MIFFGQISSYNNSELSDQTDEPIGSDVFPEFRPSWNIDSEQELKETRFQGMQDWELEVPVSNPLCPESRAFDRSSSGDQICPQYEETFNIKGMT